MQHDERLHHVFIMWLHGYYDHHKLSLQDFASEKWVVSKTFSRISEFFFEHLLFFSHLQFSSCNCSFLCKLVKTHHSNQ